MLPILVLSLDFTASDHALVSAGQTQQWAWDTPGVGPVGLGRAWGTNPGGPTLHDTIDTLEVPLPTLAGLTRPVVKVRHWYEFGLGDVGRVEVNDGTGWFTLAPLSGYPDPSGFTGASNGYTEDAWDLSGLGTDPLMRFVFDADPTLADDGWYIQRFDLWDGDVSAPEVVPDVVPEDTQDLDGPYPVGMVVTDDVTVKSVTLRWQADGGALTEVPMAFNGSVWRAQIPGQPKNTVVNWSVLATDGAQDTVWPEDVDEIFRVFLAAPTGLTGPSDVHEVGQSALLTWTPPDTPHPVTHYQVFQAGVASSLLVGEPRARVTLLPGASQTFEVEAVYNKLGPGDRSAPLSLDIEVPRLLSVMPSRVHQGERVYVRLEGESLYLQQAHTTLDLGPGISVVSLDVHNAHAAVAQIEVAVDAAIGSRDLDLQGAATPFVFRDRFVVVDGDEAPRIVSVTPNTLAQGDLVDMTLEASVELAETVTVTTDSDLVVTGQIQGIGKRITFGLAASNRARVGSHSLVVDDGRRRFVVDVDVTEFKVAPATSCATVPSSSSGAMWLALVGLLWRRRETDGEPAA